MSSDKTLIIISKPSLDDDNDKHYVLRSNDIDEMTLIGDVGITGSVIGIANTYEEARTIYKVMAD